MTQIIGALILAAGAFYGVYKGAVYASDRLSAQLKEERSLSEERIRAEERRLRMQLDSEAARLERQLAHDRWMREVEGLRQLIDEAASAGLAAGNEVHEVRELVRTAEWYLDKVEDAKLAVRGMQGFVERLELRLGKGHALPAAYSAWQLAVEEAIEPLEEGLAVAQARLQETGRKIKESAELYVAFMDAAREYVQMDPPKDS